MDRKRFLSWLSVGLGAFVAALASIPVLAAFFSPWLRKKEETWRIIGDVNDFKINTTTLVKYEDPAPVEWARETRKSAAWLRRSGESEFIAFSINCAHLGCPVRWEKEAELFMCPCHGGVYYKDGSVAAGPPPRPLGRYHTRIHNGKVEIDTASIPITTIAAGF